MAEERKHKNYDPEELRDGTPMLMIKINDKQSIEKYLHDLVSFKIHFFMLYEPVRQGIFSINYNDETRFFHTWIDSGKKIKISNKMIRDFIKERKLKLFKERNIRFKNNKKGISDLLWFIVQGGAALYNWETNQEVVVDFSSTSKEDQVRYKQRSLNRWDECFERGLKKWECIRQNKGYIQDFKNHPWKETSKSQKQKYALSQFVDPKLTSDKIRNYIQNDKREDLFREFWTLGEGWEKGAVCDNNSIIYSSDNEDFGDIPGEPARLTLYHTDPQTNNVSSTEVTGEENIRKSIPKKISITIDLSYKKMDILNEFEKIISKYKSIRELFNLPEQRKEIDWDFLKRCLVTYECKERTNITFEQVADKFYPSPKNRNSAIQQCKREYYFAKYLVEEGGFKNIP